MLKRLRYIFPETNHFKEELPRVRWEHMYGWIDGYGMLFDPVVLKLTGLLPEWENGLETEYSVGDFILCPCAESSRYFDHKELPAGLFVRPADLGEFRISEKELFENPSHVMDYSDKLEFETYHNGFDEWRIAERSVLKKCGKGLAIGFELFQISVRMLSPDVQWHERRLTFLADMIVRLLDKLDIGTDASLKIPDDLNDLRLDFQAYGISRFLLQRLLLLEKYDKAEVASADTLFIKAYDAFCNNDRDETIKQLTLAFEELRNIRFRVSAVDVQMVEVPHIGILLEDKGYFEFEWPRLAKEVIDSYLDKIENYKYRVAIEAGASCWEKLSQRYPEFAHKFQHRLKEMSGLELTNGTFSLPYALVSPLAMQYLQFALGQQTFKQTFGIMPKTYQCQENSLTPQMPEMLKHFGYEYAMHITQNHGSAPGEEHDYIRWASPSGHTIPASCSPADDPLGRMHRMGPIYYLFLPEICSYFKNKKSQLYINFQDLGYVPFRVQMIRAHNYAEVFGHYCTPIETRPEKSEELPVKTYVAEDYKLAENIFYHNFTNVNAFSHYEDVFKLFGKARLLKMINPTLDDKELQKTLCFLEAHDCDIVGGQRRGEFYASSVATPPYSRETLVDDLNLIKKKTSAYLNTQFKHCQERETAYLFNASEVDLAFACVNNVDTYAGSNLIYHDGRHYAAGKFPAFKSVTCQAETITEPIDLPFESKHWQAACVNEWIQLKHAGTAVRFRVCDKKHGSFKLLHQSGKTCGELKLLTFKFEMDTDSVFQVIKLDIVFSNVGDYAEINLSYSPRSGFDATDKWNDYLYLEFDFGAIEEVLQFNPNVYELSKKDKVVSPYCLQVNAELATFGLLNEGAFVYGVDRQNERIQWMFHVDMESVTRRRMLINFGAKDHFLLSRAWSTGLVPFDGEGNSPFPDTIPKEISIEWQLDAKRYLISNITADEITFDLIPETSVCGLASNQASCASEATLKPYEIGIMTLKNNMNKGIK